MARKPRIVLPDVVHHVVSRGANKTILFANGSEKERYLRRFSLIAAEEKVSVQGYCIMDNHVHWLLTPSSVDGLARLFRRVHTRWAMIFNRRHGRSGPLMQGSLSLIPA
jgi:putative transposase